MQWEYHQEACPLGHELQAMNAAGADGWELVNVMPVVGQTSPLATAQQQMLAVMTFKRSKVSNGQDSRINRNKLLVSR